MTSTIPEAEILRELEKDTRHAWEHYQDRLRELTGAEYERVEAESWDELQSELERLDGRREDLERRRPPDRASAAGARGHRGRVRILPAAIDRRGRRRARRLRRVPAAPPFHVSARPTHSASSVLITNARVVASPARFGAGPVLFTVTNQASSARTLEIFRGRDMRVADTAPLNPQGSTQVSLVFNRGRYSAERAVCEHDSEAQLAAARTEPLTIVVGRTRRSSGSTLLTPCCTRLIDSAVRHCQPIAFCSCGAL